MVQSAIAVADHEPVVPSASAVVAGACGDLLGLFGSVPDGRSGRGRDHPVAAVLALAAAAVGGLLVIPGGWCRVASPLP